MICIITGLMASGKSTVAELLARKFDRGVHLRGDAFRRMIVSGREDMCDEPGVEALKQLDLRYRLTAAAARGYHEAGFTVIVQDNYYGAQLPYFVGLFQQEAVKLFVLCPSIAAISQREEGRGKTGYSGFSVKPLYEAFMRDTPRIGTWIDSSLQTPEDTALEIYTEISSKRQGAGLR